MSINQSRTLWAIGSADGCSPDLANNYMNPNSTGDVTWRAGAPAGSQRWPLFHPSETDPEGGYRLHPYTVLFDLENEPAGAYRLSIQYLVIAPRLPYLELRVNGVTGEAFFRPEPSRTGEIRLHAGLHTTIYSDGVLSVVIPADLLRRGENRLELIARDGGEFIHVELIEKIKRLDRMANGAGFIYQLMTFEQLPAAPGEPALVVEPSVIYRRTADGGLAERVHLYLELGGSVSAGALTIDGRAVDLPAAAFGHLHVTFDVPDGEGEVPYSVSYQGLTWTGSFRRRRKWKVYLTPHAHTDIGYTHRQWEVAERLCRNIDAALELVRREPESFTYHLDCGWALETYLQTRSPERIAELVEQIKAGRIAVAGNYADLLTQITGLEDLIRNITHGVGLLEPHGLSTDFVTVVDVASISSSAPAVLEGAGIKYLVHANNQDRGPFRLNGGLHRISPFWWEGQAGGKVLVWLAKMYCELRKACGSPPTLHSAEQGLGMWLKEYETDEYAPDAVMLYGMEADNTDIDPQPAAFVRQWNETYAYPQLIPCDVSAFFEYVVDQFGETLKTVKGDSGAYWEDGALSSIAETMQVRKAQADLPAAERLEALAVIHNPGWAFPAGQFDEAWREVLLYDEHTWGAFLSCTEPEALLAKDQWAVKEGFARQSEARAKRLLHGAAVRHSLNWNNGGREVVVYNPHSWPVSGAFTVEIEPGEVLVDPVTGEQLPMRHVRRMSSQAVVEAWVDKVEGLSYRRFTLVRVPAVGAPVSADGPAVLENDYYRVEVDTERGCLSSWFDKELQRELIDGSDRYGFGQLLYARGGEGTRLVGNAADLPPGNPSVEVRFDLRSCQVQRYGYGTRVTLTGDVEAGPVEIEWRLPARGKWLDVRFRWLKEERLAKEAAYVAFPLALPDAAVRSDSQLGWVDWDKEQLPGGCKEWLPLQTAIHAAGADADVLICSPDIPLFCVGDVVQGRWPKELDLTGGRLFSYVLTNYWHTNYKASQGGEISFGYRLTSGKRIAPDEAFRMGWEARRGLYAHRISFQDFREPRAPYDAPAGGALAEVGPAQVSLSTITRARQGDGFIVRLQEIGGANRQASVAFPGRRIGRAWLTDLLEHDVSELPVAADGSLAVPMRAFGLATVRIAFA